MIYLIATMKFKAGTLAAAREAAEPCIAATLGEPGCARYDMFVNPNSPEDVVFVEEWQSPEALAEHMATPHVEALGKAWAPLLERQVLQVIHPERVEIL